MGTTGLAKSASSKKGPHPLRGNEARDQEVREQSGTATPAEIALYVFLLPARHLINRRLFPSIRNTADDYVQGIIDRFQHENNRRRHLG
jgi:hypothetical protein